ncbi:MAG: hypothetical protein ABJA67_02775 [Chthonomonadales bacterium]
MKTFTVIAAAAVLIAIANVQAKAQDASSIDRSGLTFSQTRSTGGTDISFTRTSGSESSFSSIAQAAANRETSYSIKPAAKAPGQGGTSAADMLVGTGVAGTILMFRRKLSK